jgi:hypothetical protein
VSRAKNLGGMIFDKKQNHKKATAEQLALLAACEAVPIDDLLDAGLRQGEVMKRLAVALHGDIIPFEVLRRRQEAREEASRQPDCRICSVLGTECEGEITRHHFLPRWLMLKLDNYAAYAARSKCTIPICIGRHRDLHLPGDTDTPKSVAQFMTDDERKFCQKMIEQLLEEHPFVLKWLSGGDRDWAYEVQLLEDFNRGLFQTSRLSSRDVANTKDDNQRVVAHLG